jgi:hypothetical protein
VLRHTADLGGWEIDVKAAVVAFGAELGCVAVPYQPIAV